MRAPDSFAHPATKHAQHSAASSRFMVIVFPESCFSLYLPVADYHTAARYTLQQLWRSIGPLANKPDTTLTPTRAMSVQMSTDIAGQVPPR
jgi:hypothetical protein